MFEAASIGSDTMVRSPPRPKPFSVRTGSSGGSTGFSAWTGTSASGGEIRSVSGSPRSPSASPEDRDRDRDRDRPPRSSSSLPLWHSIPRGRNASPPQPPPPAVSIAYSSSASGCAGANPSLQPPKPQPPRPASGPEALSSAHYETLTASAQRRRDRSAAPCE